MPLAKVNLLLPVGHDMKIQVIGKDEAKPGKGWRVINTHPKMAGLYFQRHDYR